MRRYKVLLVSCMAWFIFLCFLHYFSARPLWLDEISVFKNIETFKPAQLLGPLERSQAFPRVYLIIVKIFSRMFNYSILSLRFFSLISMLGAFFIWKKLYKDSLSNQWQFLLVLFSFASSYAFSYYAAELKPYSLDVLVVGIFCLYFIHQRRLANSQPSKLFILATLLLPFTLLLSYGSFFVFWIVVYNFLFRVRRNRKILPLILGYITISLVVMFFAYRFDLKHGLDIRGLFIYWDDYFISTKSPYYFFKSLGEGLRKLTVWWFGNSNFFRRTASIFIPFFIISLFGYGIRSIRKDKFRLMSIDAIGMVIFLELVVLGLLKKYPFTGERITLFFAPFVFYFIVKAISSFRKIKPLYLGFSVFYIVFLLICGINTFLAHLKFYG
ncbi:MAG: hypothetical protein ABIE75_04850 [Candidatus Omnitrophota bacterium]